MASELRDRDPWWGTFERGIAELGDWCAFSWRTFRWALRRKPHPGTFIPSLHEIGVATSGVVALTGMFIGMVLAIQAKVQYQQFNLTSHLGATINFSLVRELGPVLVGTMLAGRVGSRMAAELATMKITEQVDALECLGVNPLHYLVVPRLLAAVLLIPLLTVLADFAGIVGGAVVSLLFFDVQSYHYWDHAERSLTVEDLALGLIKPLFFGAAMALISC